MNDKVNKWCAVPQCNNSSKLTPDKLFVYVPHKKSMRYKWLIIARGNPTYKSLNSPIYFCEDHFDLPNDMENYMEYHLMGSVSRVRMKPGCIPTKFECQSEKKKRKCYVVRKQGKKLSKECENNLKGISRTKHVELGETSSGSSALNANMENETKEETHKIQHQNNITKSILMHTTDKLRNNVSQTKIKLEKQMFSPLQPNLSMFTSSLKVETCITREPLQLTPICIKLSGVMSKSATEDYEPKQSSLCRKEIKVFCPKCKTAASHTVEGIQEDQTKALIAKVFHYFEEELELLKKMKAKLKMSHLSKFHLRTAQATGVSETTVLEILQEEARRKAAQRYEQPRKAVLHQEVLQNAEVYEEVAQNAEVQEPPQKRRRVRKNKMESSNKETDDNIEDVRQPSVLQEIKIEPHTEEVFVKEEPVEYYDEAPEIITEQSNVKGFNNEQAHKDPISITVKEEPPHAEMNDTNESLAVQAAASKRRKIPIEFEDKESSLQEVGLVIKVEKIESGEERFS